MKSYGVTIQMKATEQYFPVVLCIMLYKVVLTFASVDEILKYDHSNESYWAVLSHGAFSLSAFHKMKFGKFIIFRGERVNLYGQSEYLRITVCNSMSSIILPF